MPTVKGETLQKKEPQPLNNGIILLELISYSTFGLSGMLMVFTNLWIKCKVYLESLFILLDVKHTQHNIQTHSGIMLVPMDSYSGTMKKVM